MTMSDVPKGWMLREQWDALVRGENCPACAEVRSGATEEGYVVARLQLSHLRLMHNQFVPGYSVLVCTRHVPEPYHLSPEEQVCFFQDLVRAARALDRVFAPTKMNLTYCPALKRGDSFAVAPIERCATPEMRLVPHAGGGRHRPNYRAGARILLPDINRADSVPVEHEPAVATAVHAPRRFVPVPTHRARPRGVPFIHQDHLHAQTLGLVGEHVPDQAAGHLVEALVGRRAAVGALPDITDVANDDGLHAALVERGDEFAGELVQRIFELMSYFLQTPLFRLDTPASAL